MGALVQKWAEARAEAQMEECGEAKDAAGPSIAMLEQRKRQRIAEWREGLSADKAEGSANFTPLGRDDWRERVASSAKRARTEENATSHERDT